MKLGVCNRIVRAFNTWWNFTGWVLFGGTFIFQYTPIAIIISLICFFLLIVWWIIDVIDRSIPPATIAIGVIIFLLAIILQLSIIYLVEWVVYMLRVRD
jgi:hypothetical protein